MRNYITNSSSKQKQVSLWGEAMILTHSRCIVASQVWWKKGYLSWEIHCNTCWGSQTKNIRHVSTFSIIPTGISMGLACALYPGGWSEPLVKQICKSDNYDPGVCTLGKSYVLAMVTAGDAIILSALAFILAYRQVTLLPWQSSGK